MKMTPNKPEVFKTEGKNFMTPDVLGYVRLGIGVYAELSTGEGMNHQPVFGVTVRPDPRHLSKLCQSRAEASAYIESLKPLGLRNKR